MELEDLKENGQAPEWLTGAGFKTLSEGYLLKGETPRGMYRRVAHSVAKYLKKPELEEKFYKYIDNNWLCLATPVASNCGTERGLPISCFSSVPGDSVDSIFNSFHETAMLTKNGGGTSKYWGNVRERGSKIKDNGFTDGIIPWLKVEEATLQSAAQGGVRRGAGAQYLPIMSNEAEDFIDIRRPSGSLDRRCLSKNFHHGVCIPDSFMLAAKSGSKKEMDLWSRLLSTRLEIAGEPYILWTDTANNNAPDCYKANKLTIKSSNLCSEVLLFSDEDHSFVCCLSSLNLFRYDEWKDTDLVETAIWFLDGIMSEFIDKASSIPGFEKAVRFAEKSRALGLGVLGWHTLLQSKMIPFESFAAMQLNGEIFRLIQERSMKATRQLAVEYGEVEWTKGFGIRNTHLNALAPTKNNAIISGRLSQGIEPIESNYFSDGTAKGTFITKNPIFDRLLKSKGKDDYETWDKVNSAKGSARKLNFLSDLEKEVFLTAREINQFAIIRQAAQRQPFIDQGQSVNLFFSSPLVIDSVSKHKLGKYVHQVHFQAWELGLKTLYYCNSESALKGDSFYREDSDCKSCEA